MGKQARAISKQANSGMNGTKLWVTDGMSEGSTMIVEGDIMPGDLLDSFPGEFA
jgi:ELWxxDGT repeat protein